MSIYYIYCVVHDLHTLPGDIFFLTVPPVWSWPKGSVKCHLRDATTTSA